MVLQQRRGGVRSVLQLLLPPSSSLLWHPREWRYVVHQRLHQAHAFYINSSLFFKNATFVVVGGVLGHLWGRQERRRRLAAGDMNHFVDVSFYYVPHSPFRAIGATVAEDHAHSSNSRSVLQGNTHAAIILKGRHRSDYDSKSERNISTSGSQTKESTNEKSREERVRAWKAVRREFETRWNAAARFIQRLPGYSYTQVYRLMLKQPQAFACLLRTGGEINPPTIFSSSSGHTVNQNHRTISHAQNSSIIDHDACNNNNSSKTSTTTYSTEDSSSNQKACSTSSRSSSSITSNSSSISVSGKRSPLSYVDYTTSRVLKPPFGGSATTADAGGVATAVRGAATTIAANTQVGNNSSSRSMSSSTSNNVRTSEEEDVASEVSSGCSGISVEEKEEDEGPWALATILKKKALQTLCDAEVGGGEGSSAMQIPEASLAARSVTTAAAEGGVAEDCNSRKRKENVRLAEATNVHARAMVDNNACWPVPPDYVELRQWHDHQSEGAAQRSSLPIMQQLDRSFQELSVHQLRGRFEVLVDDAIVRLIQ